MLDDQEEIKPKRKRVKYTHNIRHFSAYAHYRIRRKYKEILRNDCAKIINTYFQLAQEDLSLGNKVNFLNKLGNLYLTKEKREVVYNKETGQLYNMLPVNIYDSLKLWRQKPELRGKTFVRYTNEHSNGYVYNLTYELSKAKYKNKNIYRFQFHRKLKEKLRDNIFDKKVDAFLLVKYNNKTE